MNGRQRTVQIKFRVTEEERALIAQKMKLIPTDNMAAYLRKIAIDGYIIEHSAALCNVLGNCRKICRVNGCQTCGIM